MRKKIIPGFCFLIVSTLFAFDPAIRPHRSLDDFMTRYALRSERALPHSFFVQPLSLVDILEYVTDTTMTTDTGTVFFRNFKNKFAYHKGLFSKNEPLQSRSLQVNLSLLGTIDALENPGALNGRGIIRPELHGHLGRFSYYSSIDVWTEYDSDTLFLPSTYEPYDGIPYNLYGRSTESANIRASDLPRGGACYRFDKFSVEAAVDYYKQGPSFYYPLTFSGTSAPITYIRGMLDMGAAQYHHLFGLLKSQKDKPKYLYTHRLNFGLLHNKMTVGITEAIVNGSTTDEQRGDSLNVIRPNYIGIERDPELLYCIPFIPFKFVEHYNGDRDNALIAFDALYMVSKSVYLYGEFLLDDMLSPWKIFTDDWGNKWAVTLGGGYFSTLGGGDLTVRAEYSQVEPWVYTHFYGESHRFTHFGRPLGSPLGPNSQAMVLEAIWQVHPVHAIGLAIEYQAQNSSVRGGTLKDIFVDNKDSEIKQFLGDGTVRAIKPQLSWECNPGGVFETKSVMGYDSNKKSMTLGVNGGFNF